jgi:class 3 adenylate cyclase
VLDALPERPGTGPSAKYWKAATAAEALPVLGDESGAAGAIAEAAAHNRVDYAARASTRRQLELICRLKDVDGAVLAPLANPTVVHYCGHRATPESGTVGFDADAQRRARVQVDELLARLGAGFGFGSLASGADILVAEALLDSGAELHVVIPFATSEFVKVSVADGGPDWVARFHRCLERASSVTMATDGEFLDDATLFDYAARLAMGDALIRAAFLGSQAHQIALWDGEPGRSGVGTATDVERWGASGNDLTVVSVPGRGPSKPAAAPEAPRQIRALLFADMAGFSRLTDAQVLLFTREVIARLADVIDEFAPSILSRETWGDGIYLVLSDVGAAAECALALQAAVRAMDLEGLGLAPLRGMRIGAHVGPVFEGWDPISDRRSFAGSHVTRAARIEPRTPEGEVYVTHSFAALAALEAPDVWCQYVGQVPAAKDYGALPMYVLKPRRVESAGLAP